MRAVDLIQKKKDNISLSQDEIKFLVEGFTKGEIPDYQMSAFLMACCFHPPVFKETMELTKAMLFSGEILDFSKISVPKVDKHSTGGVGDKTSLIIAPIVASLGIAVPMISGRGLGHTGGTLDKLEAIPGFNIHLTLDQFREYLSKIHVAMMGQTPEIAPADKKMYSLRDVTATVECIPLISASIMSKKLAEGTDGIVLDVKYGSGAFMQDFKEAKELATWLVKIGKTFKKRMVALVTDMNQPLGNKVGNSLEVEESIDVLKGEGPKDLTDLSLLLSGHMILLGKRAKNLKEGVEKAKKAIQSGEALSKFREMVKLQGGDERIVHSYHHLPQARHKAVMKAEKKGYISEINAKNIGKAACLLGCGREKVEDVVDPAVGFCFHKKVGDFVEKGETLLTIYYNDEKKRALADQELGNAYRFSLKRGTVKPLVRETIGL